MKTTHLCITGMILCSGFAKAQTPSTNEKIQKQIDSTGNFNMLDAQAGILGDIFGDMGGLGEFQNLKGFMDLVNRANMNPEQKKQAVDIYKIHDLSLDPRKKDSLNLAFIKLLKEAKRKSLDPER